MHQIVILLSLGFLAVWTIGPFVFLSFIMFHDAADFLDSMLPLSEPNKRGSTPRKWSAMLDALNEMLAWFAQC
jgi:hypothetical protein